MASTKDAATETLLVVGGAHAGRSITVSRDAPTVGLLVEEPPQPPRGLSDDVPATATITTVVYDRSKWRSGGPPYKEWSFLKPVKWTDDMVMEELLANYRP